MYGWDIGGMLPKSFSFRVNAYNMRLIVERTTVVESFERVKLLVYKRSMSNGVGGIPRIF